MKILICITDGGQSVSINCDMITYVADRGHGNGCTVFMLEKPNGLTIREGYLETIGFMKSE